MVQLTQDYAERVYAGVLGKVIGVYLGRPFEGWSYERIQQRLGDIEYYVFQLLSGLLRFFLLINGHVVLVSFVFFVLIIALQRQG